MTKLRTLGLVIAVAIFLVVFMLIAPVALAQQSGAGQGRGKPSAEAFKGVVVIATVPVGDAPVQLTVNQTTNMIYVANFLSSNITAINGATNSTITITDQNARGPYDVVANEQTNKIYVPNFDSGNVTVIDGATNTTTTVRDPNAGCPAFAAVNSQTDKIYVTNWCSNNVTVIDGASNSTTTIAVGNAPLNLAVNEVTNKIYVANQHGGNVTVIDGATNGTITVKDPHAKPYAGSIAVNQETNKIYVSNAGSNNVTVIDGGTNATTTVTDANAINPSVVAVDEATNTIYVENGGSGPYVGSNNVTVINGATNAIITVPSGSGTDGVAVDAALNLMYVPDWGSNSVTLINGATNGMRTLSDPNASGPSDVVVNPTTHTAYVANGGGFPFGGSNNVTVIGMLLATHTTVTTSGSPSLVGQPVTFTATVTPVEGTIPNGETVTFFAGRNEIGTGITNGGVATFTASSLATKTYTIKAIYSGDPIFKMSSGIVSQVVTGYSTSTTCTSSLNPSIYGQPVTLTATVSTTGSVAPTGNVAFSWSNETLGTTSLSSSGVATLTIYDLNADTYPLVAVYKGDANNVGSTSAIVNQSVEQATSSATLTSSPNPSTLGQSVAFNVEITSPTVTASGPVTFTAGNTVLGTVELRGGKAQFTTSALPAGSPLVKVTYDGDSNIKESSASVTEVVQP